MTCIDIGANEGYFTVLMAQQCKKVWAFEPEPKNFSLLIDNTKNLDNIDARNLAVSDKTGLAKLYLCTANYNGAEGMHRIYPSKWCSDISISIPSVSLDTFFLGKIKPDFIKIDIEGAELDAINGMYNILKTYHPIIIMEFHPPSIQEKGDNPEKLYYRLKVLGYHIYLIPDVDNEISYENLLIETSKEPSGRNLLLKPS